MAKEISPAWDQQYFLQSAHALLSVAMTNSKVSQKSGRPAGRHPLPGAD